MEPSKFHFFSFGVVAANKARGSDMVQVVPTEKFFMMSGEMTDNVDKIDVKGKDADGKDYQETAQTKAPLTCKWIPLGEPNRVTPPDVRRNEQVLIYRYGDTQYYFWTSAFNNVLRKLETVGWWWSGDPNDSPDDLAKRTADNGYFLQISSHDKNIILSTSKLNGEKCRYRFQFDMANGHWTLGDDLGNEIELDSVAGVLTATTENKIIQNTKDYTVNCENYIVNAKTKVYFDTPKTTMSTDMEVGGNSLQKGFSNFTTGIGGGNSGDENAPLSFKGNVNQTGSWTTNGTQTINGELTVHGTGTFDGNVNAPNI